MNKKGISLIVLVITIIVMIIIAGAIILSLNSSNVTAKATYATKASDRANYQAEVATEYATYMAENYETDPEGTGFSYSRASEITSKGFTLVGTDVYYTGVALEGVPSDVPSWYSPQS